MTSSRSCWSSGIPGSTSSEWGSRLSPGSGVFIITGYDRAKFIATLTETR